jgi:YVTN family beta-propeller protein
MRRSIRFLSNRMVRQLGSTIVTAIVMASVVHPKIVRASAPANKVVATITVGQQPTSLAVTPASDAVYVTNLASNTVTVINASLNTVAATIGVGQGPDSVAIAPNGQTAFVSNATDSTVSVVSTATNSVTTTFSVGYGPLAVAVTPDGTQLYVSVHGAPLNSKKDGGVWIVDTSTFEILNKIQTNSRPSYIRFTTDGKSAYVLDENSFVTQIDTASEKIVRTKIGDGQLTDPAGLVISPDASTLYVANFRNEVLAFSSVTGSLLKAIKVFPSSVPYGNRVLAGLSITPDGDFLYASDYYISEATMVDTSTEKRSGSPISLTTPYPYNSAIAPNGNYLYIAVQGNADGNGNVTVVDIQE